MVILQQKATDRLETFFGGQIKKPSKRSFTDSTTRAGGHISSYCIEIDTGLFLKIVSSIGKNSTTPKTHLDGEISRLTAGNLNAMVDILQTLSSNVFPRRRKFCFGTQL